MPADCAAVRVTDGTIGRWNMKFILVNVTTGHIHLQTEPEGYGKRNVLTLVDEEKGIKEDHFEELEQMIEVRVMKKEKKALNKEQKNMIKK